MYSFFEENNINFSVNEFYKQDIEDISNPIFNAFLHDVNEIVQNGSYVFNVGSSMSNSPSFHLLTGLKKGELSISPNGTFLEYEKAQAILDDLTERSKTLNYEITTCSHYGNSSEDHIDWYISRKLGASSMSIKVNIEFMKGNHDNYYQSIGFLGDSIKQNCP
jgi:hypothetical protein